MENLLHAVGDFLGGHLHELLSAFYGIVAAIVGWFALNMIARPILALRGERLEALRVAERYAYFGPLEQDDRIREVRRELFDIASKLRSQSRSLSWPVRCYYRLLRYDIEGAADALRGLGAMAGESVSDQVRLNNLNHVYISLRAHRHLSRETVRAHHAIVAAEGRAEARADFRYLARTSPPIPDALMQEAHRLIEADKGNSRQ